jgi:hypothetical protein
MRRLGVWLVTAYLLMLLALGAIYLSVFGVGGSLYRVLCQTTYLLIELSATILLLLRIRWAAVAVGLLVALQAVSFWAYVDADPVPFIVPSGTDAVVTVVPLTYIWTPLALLGATLGSFLYTAWLWRAGELR